MKINNTVLLAWSVDDPVYPYRANYSFTVDEFKQVDMADIAKKQEAEYSEWLNALKAAERGE